MKTALHACLFLLIPLAGGQDIVPFKENEEHCRINEELKYTVYNVIHETLARIMPRFISDIKDTGKSLIELEDESKTLLSQLETLEQTVQKMKKIAGLPEFSCTFEPHENCFLENAANDDFDWTTRKGQTPSKGTGPNSASERLYYSYIEVPDLKKSGETASLVSKWIITGGEKCLLFDYHMHGDGMGILKVFTFNTTDEDEIYLKSGDQGCEWNTAIIPLTNANSYKLRIDGIRGSNLQGDIAIDNVKVVAEKCEIEMMKNASLEKDEKLTLGNRIKNISNISSDEHLGIRLVGGCSTREGRVEVYKYTQSQWGTVCDDYFDNSDGQVVCKMLGFSRVLSVNPKAYFGQGTGTILMDEVDCSGSESSIFQCRYDSSHDCYHSEDVGVRCE